MQSWLAALALAAAVLTGCNNQAEDQVRRSPRLTAKRSTFPQGSPQLASLAVGSRRPSAPAAATTMNGRLELERRQDGAHLHAVCRPRQPYPGATRRSRAAGTDAGGHCVARFRPGAGRCAPRAGRLRAGAAESRARQGSASARRGGGQRSQCGGSRISRAPNPSLQRTQARLKLYGGGSKYRSELRAEEPARRRGGRENHQSRPGTAPGPDGQRARAVRDHRSRLSVGVARCDGKGPAAAQARQNDQDPRPGLSRRRYSRPRSRPSRISSIRRRARSRCAPRSTMRSARSKARCS